MQQTMLRVKDPARSLDFYTRILGMTWVLSLNHSDDPVSKDQFSSVTPLCPSSLRQYPPTQRVLVLVLRFWVFCPCDFKHSGWNFLRCPQSFEERHVKNCSAAVCLFRNCLCDSGWTSELTGTRWESDMLIPSNPLTSAVFQVVAENRLPFDAFHPLLPGLRGQDGHPSRRQREDGVDFLSPSHHRAHTVRMTATVHHQFVISSLINVWVDGRCLSVSNWGSESDENLSYHNGNNQPQGFGEKLVSLFSDDVEVSYCCWL